MSLLFVSTLLGLALPLLAPTPPASAWLVCQGAGTATFAPGLVYPVLLGLLTTTGGKDHPVDVLVGDGNVIHSFTMNTGAGVCAHIRTPLPTLSAAVAGGVALGWCGHSVGIGTWSGQPFSYVGAGNVLLLTGHVVGAVHLMLVSATGNCEHIETSVPPSDLSTGGATHFFATSAVVGLNCPNSLPPTKTSMPLVDQDALVAQTLGLHVHVDLHLWTTQPCVGPPVLP